MRIYSLPGLRLEQAALRDDRTSRHCQRAGTRTQFGPCVTHQTNQDAFRVWIVDHPTARGAIRQASSRNSSSFLELVRPISQSGPTGFFRRRSRRTALLGVGRSAPRVSGFGPTNNADWSGRCSDTGERWRAAKCSFETFNAERPARCDWSDQKRRLVRPAILRGERWRSVNLLC
jgi:hypothetical protein